VKSRLSRARNELRKILDGEADAKVVSIVDVRAQRETGRGEREARSAAATKRLSEQFSALLRAPSAAPLHWVNERNTFRPELKMTKARLLNELAQMLSKQSTILIKQGAVEEGVMVTREARQMRLLADVG
jgi:hypothetical protein